MAALKPMEVGDRVAIRKASRFYGEHIFCNPADHPGTIVESGDIWPYKVQWDNGATNHYRREDLKYWTKPSRPKVSKEKPYFPALIAKAKGIVKETGMTAHYAFVYNDGEVMENINHACHAQVMDSNGKSVHSIVTLIRRVRSKDNPIFKAYMEWLIERSPWSKAFSEPFSESWESRFAVVTSDCPANILQGALIASRTTHEYPNKVELWYELRHRGVKENDAFVLASLLHENNGDLSLSPHGGGHYPLRASAMGTEGFKAFCEGRPLFENEPYIEGGKAMGVHRTFEGSGNLIGAMKAIIKKAGEKTTVVKNPFTKAKPGHMRDRDTVSIDKFVSYYLEKGIDNA